ncbi:hypothetical protein [Gemmatimonas sp.]|uniref:hypothetical protein n=1 Tax=Gemmatimonas sp. TaxID=1962908 RepID=UPI0035672302
MAKNPSLNTNYQANAFNPNLAPQVRICALDATSAAAVMAATLCKSPGYALVVTATVDDGKYAYNWAVPKNGVPFYRVSVFVGATQLGFTDVATVKSEGFEVVNDGRTLPIKFRIEQYALCATPGIGPCASTTINLATGGTVTTTLGGGSAGVIIPPQPVGFVTTVTTQICPDLNNRVTDLPTFGPCVRVTASPALLANALPNEATMFICAVQSLTPLGMLPAQKERLTMHRFDAAPDRLAALPHATATCIVPVAQGTVKGLMREVARGEYASAGRELFAMLAPKRLNAATRRLDVGPGALTDEFSDFQFALPAKLSIVAGDGQTGTAGNALPVNPTVRVTDLAGVAVPNARVRFAASIVACNAASPGSGALSNFSGDVVDGAWIITSGANTRAACGRGLAGVDSSGPRAGVDPFQPLSLHFGDGSNGPEVAVKMGSVLFSATGITLPTTLVPLGSNGYSSYGPFDQSITPPTGWPNLASGTSTTLGGKAPFLSGGCGVPAGYAGPYAYTVGKDIFVTKSVSVPVNGTLEITVLIDNDLRIWVDGTERTGTIPPTSAPGFYNSMSGFWQHDNCVNDGPAVLTLSGVSAGTHTIALWARDRGGDAFLDMKVMLKP